MPPEQVVGSWRRWLPLVPIAVLFTIVHFYATVPHYFFGDDFALRYLAHVSSFDANYLFDNYNGHINPVGNALTWIGTHLAPGNYAIFAWMLILLGLATLAVAWALMLRITGSLWSALATVVVLGFSLFMFEVRSWWAAGAYAVPMVLFSFATLYLIVRALTYSPETDSPETDSPEADSPEAGSPEAGSPGSNRRWWWLAGLSYAALLLSHSRAFPMWLVLFGFAAFIPRGGKALGPVAAFKASPPFWMATAAAGGIYGLIISTQLPAIASDSFSWATARKFFGEVLANAVSPASLGGPWQWQNLGNDKNPNILFLPTPDKTLQIVAAVGVIVACSAVIHFQPKLRGALAIAATYVVGIVLANSMVRHSLGIAPTPYRYHFDIVVPLAVVVGLSLNRPRFAVPIISALAVSLAISTAEPLSSIQGETPSQRYLERAKSTFGIIPEGTSILPQASPEDVFPPTVAGNWGSTRTLIEPEPGSPPFAAFVQDKLYGFASDGTATEMVVFGPPTKPGPEKGCGYRLFPGWQAIRLTDSLEPKPYTVALDYATNKDGFIEFQVGAFRQRVPLIAGFHRVHFAAYYGGDRFQVRPIGDAIICLGGGQVGARMSTITGDVTMYQAAAQFDPRVGSQ